MSRTWPQTARRRAPRRPCTGGTLRSPRPPQQLRRLARPLERWRRVEFDALAASRLAPARLEIFQVNLGKLCNMTCRHCHVDAGPDRTDAMMDGRDGRPGASPRIRATGAPTVDITGGAPELHPRFRDLVEAAAALGKHVMDRCNLTVLLLPRNAGLVDWLAERRVEVVASLPHYRAPQHRRAARRRRVRALDARAAAC